jgi:hypothetical protein
MLPDAPPAGVFLLASLAAAALKIALTDQR